MTALPESLSNQKFELNSLNRPRLTVTDESKSSNQPGFMPIGKKNSTEVPFIPLAKIRKTIGQKIGEGCFGTIYRVTDSIPQRVYKIIPEEAFQNGNEIRITKIAAKTGVTPAFHNAFLVQFKNENRVFLEMAYAGKSLDQLMEEDKNNPPLTQQAEEEEIDLSADYSAISAIMRIEKASMEAAIDKLYEKREDFYFELFSNLKILAENNISYMDSACGNIIPGNGAEKSLQLIDFDSAIFAESQETAAQGTIQSPCNQQHMNDFCKIKNLSDKSQELIKWFKSYARDL